MPLSAAERRRIFERLESFEQSQEDFVDLQVAELNAAYEGAVRDTTENIREALRRIDDEDGVLVPDEDIVADVTLETLESVNVVQPLWRQWRKALTDFGKRIDRVYELPGQAGPIGDADRALIDQLLGSWPTRKNPTGQGTAGRFYTMSLHHRQELANTLIY